MRLRKTVIVYASLLLIAISGFGIALPTRMHAAEPPAQTATPRPVGTIKAINGNVVTLATDSGVEMNISIPDTTRIVRVEPGQTDLKSAAPIQLKDLQVGDRILARVAPGGDQTPVATVVIAMKRNDIQQKQQQEQQQWQQGIGGVVTAIDPSTGTITVSASAPGGTKSVAIHTTKTTIVRRYAPNSIKFDDAKPGTLDQVKSGDQLRARGTKSPDGSSMEADEIVAGTFRNISGTISSIDAGDNSVNVMDLATKKSVLVKLSPDSQVRKIPPQVAQRIAVQMKGAKAGDKDAPESAAGGGSPAANGAAEGGRRAGGDLQQLLGRMPAATLTDFQKGDAVMIVATEGTSDTGVTAITMLGGVEPILQASPKESQTMLLSPWNIGGAPGGGEGQAP